MYVRGLLGPGDRKSVGLLAARVAPNDYGQVHHFVCASCWPPEPLERVLAAKAQELVGGPDPVLIVDDTALLKQGRRSVGVARQYAGAAGKTANCRTLVPLTLAHGEVPVGLALRLFLPAEWTADPDRCRAAGVPRDRLAYRTKLDLALDEVDRVTAAGVTYGCVLADAGYGISAYFRQALSARGLTWAVGIPRVQKVYPADVTTHMPAPRPGAHHGRPRVHPVPSVPSAPAEQVLAAVRWRRLAWRTGTKGPLSARFAAARVVVADGVQNAGGQHLPGEAVWLVGERRDSGETKYHLTNHDAGTPLRALAAAVKARWACEQAAAAAQGGAGPRPLRGAHVDGAPPPRAADAHQLLLPPTPPPRRARRGRGAGEEPGRRTPSAPARRPRPRCRRSAARCPPGTPPSTCAAQRATGGWCTNRPRASRCG